MDISEKRILIIKQSSLGDVIHTLPVAHAIKRTYPSCHIGWVVEQGYAELLENDPAIDTVYPIHIPATSDPLAKKSVYWDAFLATIRTLLQLRKACKRIPYDISLDLHASFRSGVLAVMNPGGRRVGFKNAKELNTFFQHQHVRVADDVQHALEKNIAFTDFLSCPVQEADFHIFISPEARDGAALFLRQHKIGEMQPVAYMNPTARWETKFWDVKRWAVLADQLINSGVGVVFGGSRNDLPYIASITDHMVHKPVVAAGKQSLVQAVALIKAASVYVGLDTGPMHIAAMAKTPVVALFGPTHPERVGPYKVEHRVLQAGNLDCLCCRRRSCTHMSCMKAITVDQVYEAVTAFVEMK
ncbi:MAG: ADP-heptose--LPS heptosyltransferase [Desulfobulbus propionicus]|nr:MAG: ADP-heptose--LPS heptosyltransferase [Desulfobulbus propionicus]